MGFEKGSWERQRGNGVDFRANTVLSEEWGRDRGGWTMVAKEARNLVYVHLR